MKSLGNFWYQKTFPKINGSICENWFRRKRYDYNWTEKLIIHMIRWLILHVKNLIAKAFVDRDKEIRNTKTFLFAQIMV